MFKPAKWKIGVGSLAAPWPSVLCIVFWPKITKPNTVRGIFLQYILIMNVTIYLVYYLLCFWSYKTGFEISFLCIFALIFEVVFWISVGRQNCKRQRVCTIYCRYLDIMTKHMRWHYYLLLFLWYIFSFFNLHFWYVCWEFLTSCTVPAEPSKL